LTVIPFTYLILYGLVSPVQQFSYEHFVEFISSIYSVALILP